MSKNSNNDPFDKFVGVFVYVWVAAALLTLGFWATILWLLVKNFG